MQRTWIIKNTFFFFLISTCLQYIMTRFLLVIWYVYIIHLNFFIPFPFLLPSLNLLPFCKRSPCFILSIENDFWTVWSSLQPLLLQCMQQNLCTKVDCPLGNFFVWLSQSNFYDDATFSDDWWWVYSSFVLTFIFWKFIVASMSQLTHLYMTESIFCNECLSVGPFVERCIYCLYIQGCDFLYQPKNLGNSVRMY